MVWYIGIIVILCRRFEVIYQIAGILDVNYWSHARHILPLPQIAHTHFRLGSKFYTIIDNTWFGFSHSDMRL